MGENGKRSMDSVKETKSEPEIIMIQRREDKNINNTNKKSPLKPFFSESFNLSSSFRM